MKLIQLDEIFEIFNGNGLALNDLNLISREDKNISFISRTSANNGISDMIDEIESIKPFEAGLITVSLGGSVLEAFVQPNKFYTGYHVAVLKPKMDMSLNMKLAYAMFIQKNKYRYSYGRQANKTLQSIMLPHPDDLPLFVGKDVLINDNKLKSPILSNNCKLEDRRWKYFSFDELFEIKRGSENKIPDNSGSVPFVSATEKNNGILDYIDAETLEAPNQITVSNDGSIGETFFQEEEFIASIAVTILSNPHLNKYNAMFINTLIRKEKYRFSYGRKWGLEKMKKSIIKLPVDDEGNPDWQFMEDYIKSLPFSSSI